MEYDLFVIGGGSGGVRSARYASEKGFKVGIAETKDLGGTCVNRGCIPKKLFVQVSDFKDYIDDALNFGWDLEKLKFIIIRIRGGPGQDLGARACYPPLIRIFAKFICFSYMFSMFFLYFLILSEMFPNCCKNVSSTFSMVLLLT